MLRSARQVQRTLASRRAIQNLAQLDDDERGASGGQIHVLDLMHRRWLSRDATDRVGRAEVPALRGPLVLGERNPMVDDGGMCAEILSELASGELATDLSVATRPHHFVQWETAAAELGWNVTDSRESVVRVQRYLS